MKKCTVRCFFILFYFSLFFLRIFSAPKDFNACLPSAVTKDEKYLNDLITQINSATKEEIKKKFRNVFDEFELKEKLDGLDRIELTQENDRKRAW